MSFQDVRPSPLAKDFETLGEWARRLSIPARTLLHHGAQGALRLFTMPNPFLDVDYYSVHEDFIGNAAVPLPHEAHPISMSEPDVMGLALANEACAQLAAGAKVEQSLFAAIIRRQDIVQPIAGRFRSKLRSDGWRIAAYKRINPAEGGEWNAHSPVSLKIAAVNVYVRDVDIEEFMARLKSYQFIVDLFPGDRVAAKLPPYVSGKLSEMINANRLFWNDADMIDAPERERRRVEVLKYLKSAFSQLCDKQSKPKSLAKFAANFCDSALMPKSQKLLSTSVTPAMLALLTAAKLYWSAHCKHSPTHETYPSREAIVEFLRFMGLREANAASAGATLIRPEALRAPEPQPDWLTTLLRRRQGLRHSSRRGKPEKIQDRTVAGPPLQRATILEMQNEIREK